MKKNVLSLTFIFALILAFALPVLASVPPPPANQTIGVDDTVFGEFTEADCRLCHEDPDIVGPTSIPDRHHLLYGSAIPSGSIVPDPDADNDGIPDTTYGCLNCHLEDIVGGVIVMQVWRDCTLCHTSSPHHQTAAAQSGDCVHCHGTLVDNPTGCKELYCAVASSSAGSTRGVPLVPCTIEGGTECNTLGLGGGPLAVCANTTTLCASDADCVGIGTGVCSSSTSSRCGMFGGEATCDDGHVIPTYAPSLVTPARSGHIHVCALSGNCSVSGDPCSIDDDCPATETCDADSCDYDTDCTAGTCSTTTTQECHVDMDCPGGETCVGGVECIQEHEDGLVGGCTYCHTADPNLGTVDPASGVLVRDNHDTHHGAGVHSGHSERCAWCHMAGYPHSVYGELPEHIRWCENCHGYESLHNIAIDSDTGCLFGDPGCTVVIGGELPGYSHVGNNDDCWGCHGFETAAAPGSGPATPYLFASDTLGATSGYDTTVTLIGATLQNLVGTYLWSSDISMTAADGSSVTLTPESATSNQLAVTIPAATAPGNYALRAVKGTSAASNPIVISVKPEVAITDSSCDRKKGVLSVSGTGFGEKPAGSDAYINVQVNGQSVDVTSWSDTQITASISSCKGNAAITVNAVMGSATSGGGGKPAKPCKGKNCN